MACLFRREKAIPACYARRGVMTIVIMMPCFPSSPALHKLKAGIAHIVVAYNCVLCNFINKEANRTKNYQSFKNCIMYLNYSVAF